MLQCIETVADDSVAGEARLTDAHVAAWLIDTVGVVVTPRQATFTLVYVYTLTHTVNASQLQIHSNAAKLNNENLS